MKNSHKSITIMIFAILLAFNPFKVESDNNLVAHYPFNGNAMDESGNENHGTINGATLTYDRFGVFGNAYSFDGVDDYISFAPILLEQDHSIVTWIYIRTLDPDPDNVIIENSDSSTLADYGLYALYEADVLNEFQIYYFLRSASGTGYQIGDDSKYDLNKWYQVVATYDGNFAKIYINGQLTVSEELSITLRQDATVLSVGDDAPGGDANLDGNIDEVRFYNRTLNEVEIQEIYRQQIYNTYLPMIKR